MNKNTDSSEILLEKLISRCELETPIPGEDRNFEYASSKRVLKNIFKKAGITSTSFIGLYFTFYFLLKKLGVSLLTVKIIISGVAIGVVSTSSYVIYKKVIIPAITKEKVIEEKKEIQNNKEEEKKKETKILFKTGFKPFLVENKSIPKELISQISTKLIQECNKEMGSNFAGKIGFNEEKNCKYAVISNISKLNNDLVINLKIVDSRTGKLHYSIIEYGKMDNIDELCRRCAKGFIKKYEEFK